MSTLLGRVCVEVITADIGMTLSVLHAVGIDVSQIIKTGNLTYCLTVNRTDYRKVKVQLGKRGDHVRILDKKGIYWYFRYLLKRPVLLTALILLAVFELYLPSHILFLSVEGNRMLSEQQILQQAERSGIRFGASRREVRSEKIKNNLLEALPELQWAGINTYGCTAVISVQEKTVAEKQNQIENGSGISCIVASRDSVVTSCTVVRGSALCKIGEAVKKGQKLISGYTDLGLRIRGEIADGEVYGQTIHSMCVKMPVLESSNGGIISEKKKYSVRIGKKQINFFQDSGISDSSCGKMYEEYPLILPGGFRLPVALIVTKQIQYKFDEIQSASAESSIGYLQAFAKEYLGKQMISGQIQDASHFYVSHEKTIELHGLYRCVEMIGRVQSEELIEQNE